MRDPYSLTIIALFKGLCAIFVISASALAQAAETGSEGPEKLVRRTLSSVSEALWSGKEAKSRSFTNDGELVEPSGKRLHGAAVAEQFDAWRQLTGPRPQLTLDITSIRSLAPKVFLADGTWLMRGATEQYSLIFTAIVVNRNDGLREGWRIQSLRLSFPQRKLPVVGTGSLAVVSTAKRVFDSVEHSPVVIDKRQELQMCKGIQLNEKGPTHIKLGILSQAALVLIPVELPVSKSHGLLSGSCTSSNAAVLEPMDVIIKARASTDGKRVYQTVLLVLKPNKSGKVVITNSFLFTVATQPDLRIECDVGD